MSVPSSPPPVERDFAKVTKHNRTLLRNTMKAVHRAALYVLPDENIRPAPNVLALANRLMTMWFGVKKGEPQLAEHIVGLLKQHIRGGDAEEVYRQVEQRWAPMSKVPDPITYLCIMGFARTALVPYADATPAHTLYFGCEPYFRRVVTYGRCDAVPVDFSGAVEAEQARTVYIFQPRLDGNEALIARALKATWFEAILSSRKRSRAGHSMPLAAYIADEFHRFVTCGQGARGAVVPGHLPVLRRLLRAGLPVHLQHGACAGGRGRELAEEPGRARHPAEQHRQQAFFQVHRPGLAGLPGPPVSARSRLEPGDTGAPAIDPATRGVLCLTDRRALRAAPVAAVHGQRRCLRDRSEDAGMKIQIASDLHFEIWRRFMPDPADQFAPDETRDLLVLAGDITDGNRQFGVSFIRRELQISPVIYVPGNHEYYHAARRDTERFWRVCAGDNEGFYYLNDETVDIGGLRFYGAEWCSDFWGQPPIQFHNIIEDFHVTSGWDTYAHLAEHKRITEAIAALAGKVDVVVTHFPPTLEAIDQALYAGDKNNPYFHQRCRATGAVRGCEALGVGSYPLARSTIKVGQTRVIGNPRGYPGEDPRPGFSVMKTVEV